MATLDDFLLEDLIDDVLAADIMALRAAALRAEYKNTETIVATKQLTDNDTPIQLITASGASRDVKLAAEATTNHVTVIYNNGASNNVVVKDDSGAITFVTLSPGGACVAYPMGGVTWKVMNVISFATAGQTSTGTDASSAVTPDGLAGSIYGTRYIALTIADSNTTPVTGDGQSHCVIPADLNGYDVVSVLGAVTTVSSSGTPTFALRRLRSGSAVDVLSTNVTVDASEYTSASAATPAVINTSNDDLQTGDILLLDLDTVGTGAKGHQLVVGVRLP